MLNALAIIGIVLCSSLCLLSAFFVVATLRLRAKIDEGRAPVGAFGINDVASTQRMFVASTLVFAVGAAVISYWRFG